MSVKNTITSRKVLMAVRAGEESTFASIKSRRFS